MPKIPHNCCYEQAKYLQNMENLKELLEEFIDWARDCGEEVFYVFDDTEKAIEEFFKQREEQLTHKYSITSKQ